MKSQQLIELLCRSDIGILLRENPELITDTLPEIGNMIGFDQKSPHHIYDLWEHTLRTLEAVPPIVELRLAMLFHDTGKYACYTEGSDGIRHFSGHAKYSMPIAKNAMTKLGIDEHMQKDVLHLVRHHDTPLGQTVSEVRRKLATHGEKYFRWLLAVHKADCLGKGTYKDDLVDDMNSEIIFEKLVADEGVFSVDKLAAHKEQLNDKRTVSFLMNTVLDNWGLNTRQELIHSLEKMSGDNMVITVVGMSWSHCVKEVKKLLADVDGVQSIDIQLASGRTELTGRNISFEKICSVLKEAGYGVI